jgi:hypothetical protein
MFYVMLALPALFGLTLFGEGVYRMSRCESGWISLAAGCVFMMAVTFGYFFLKAG